VAAGGDADPAGAGGELEAAALLAEQLVGSGLWDVRVGVADELFTAEQAARQAVVQGCVVVPPGGSGEFLRPLPVDVLDRATATLLHQLGLHLLGDLAGLTAAEVSGRFGADAAWVRRVLIGQGVRPVAGRVPPPDLTCEVDFEPPLESAETVCASMTRAAEELVVELGRRQLVCTEVRVRVWDGDGLASERVWAHPRWFAAVDLIDRLHWQLVRSWGITSAVTRVGFVPEVTVAESVHAEGLWGGTDARVERGIARVQGMLGHEAVVAPVLQGGRSPAERQALVPWGDRPRELRPRERPWPGAIPPPAPTRVFPEPWWADVLDAAGRPVLVHRDRVSGIPTRYRPGPGGPWQRVVAWAGPWPVPESWWEAPEIHREVSRFQLVAGDGQAWLATFDTDHWRTEAAY
jgi:protein ImuB